jgi:hypothetical protein
MKDNYLHQYIRESQIEYPSISKTPVSVLKHMLFTNGNGVEIDGSNFVEYVSFYRTVPFTEYYKDTRTFQEMKEYHSDRCSEKEYLENYERIKDTNEFYKSILDDDKSDDIEAESIERLKLNIKTDDEMYDKAWDEYYNRYDGMDIIDELPDGALTDVDYLYQTISKYDYLPYLQLSAEYYKAYYFDENTEHYLKEVTVALSKALVKFMSEYLLGEHSEMRSPFGNDERMNIGKTYKKDIETLTTLIEKLS